MSARLSESFLVSDSDNDKSLENIVRSSKTRVIPESSLDSIENSDEEGLENKLKNSSGADSDDNATEFASTSEDEDDRQFVNKSLHTSIIVGDSDEENSDSEERRLSRVRSFGRKSIYDNPDSDLDSPKRPSSPIGKTKKNRRVIESDDSDNDDEPSNFRDKNGQQFNKISILKNEVVTPLKDKRGREIAKSLVSDDDSAEDVPVVSLKSNLKVSKKAFDSDNSVQSLNYTKEDKHDSSAFFIDDSESEKENNCSLDKEAVNLAKKQIGVGNIDPILAQEKEILELNIEKLENDRRKFKAMIESDKCNLYNLPDHGKKLIENEKKYEKHIEVLRQQLNKINIKINPKPQIKVKMENSFKSPIKPPTIKKEELRQLSLSPSSSPERKPFTDFSINIKKNSPPEDDNVAFNILPKSTFRTDYLGDQAMDTYQQERALTQERLQKLHGSLNTRPSEDTKHSDPPGLKVTLMPHQQHALAWLKWREEQDPKGGILADDMGLGKTLTMISLVLAKIDNNRDSDSDDSSDDGSSWYKRGKSKSKRMYGGTLVVCPASLIQQWESEVKNRLKRGLLTVHVYHGNSRNVTIRKLSRFNIVVTTYQTLVRDHKFQGTTYEIEWDRVILDEAHYIRNYKSQACTAVCELYAKYRWALSGTPIQNKELDLYAIMKFLVVTPFNDLRLWRKWVDNKNELGSQRLAAIMKSIMLRRTKKELSAKGQMDSLPPKETEIIEISLDPEEDLCYKKILLFSQTLFAQFLHQRAEKDHMREMGVDPREYRHFSNRNLNSRFTKAQQALLAHHKNDVSSHEILVLILRLRQMCCHPALIHKFLDSQEVEINGLEGEEDVVNMNLIDKLTDMSMGGQDEELDPICDYDMDNRVKSHLLTKSNPVFDDDRKSSKVKSVLKLLKEIIEKGDKVIVVSQWTSFLNVIASHVKNEIQEAQYCMFTGEVAVKDRQAVVDKFNRKHSGPNVMFLSLTAGGVGLNLVGANNLILVDIHWNPQLESQAQDRIYRFGQTKEVRVYKFLCKDTIEEKIKRIQDNKLQKAHDVLTGTRSISSKLTIEDLQTLFS